MNTQRPVSFLTLKVFSATGGIEKVCRMAGKALEQLCQAADRKLNILSMYDATADARGNAYFSAVLFRGYSKAKARFMLAALAEGKRSGTVLLSHINLLPAGWLIKKISPSTKVILLAHGIEIWGPLSYLKKKMLAACDEIWAVSEYTKGMIISRQGMDAAKCKVLHNCLDPFLPAPANTKNERLLQQYNFGANDPVLLTLTRLSATERYKNYDKIITIVAGLKTTFPGIRYLLAGKYDAAEEQFLRQLIASHGLAKQVILTGFIAENEMADYFSLADLYIMPSKKEGFGITFIEAMYYGLPVIAGNKDGSADALLDGRLGTLIDPDDMEQIRDAIEKILLQKQKYIPNRQLLMEAFSFDTYQQNIAALLH